MAHHTPLEIKLQARVDELERKYKQASSSLQTAQDIAHHNATIATKSRDLLEFLAKMVLGTVPRHFGMVEHAEAVRKALKAKGYYDPPTT